LIEEEIAGRTFSEIAAADPAVKVIYVDNCCQVYQLLKGVFPGARVLLDAFHWLKRWNECLHKPSSSQAGIFSALMSRAIFHVEPAEFERAKGAVQRKKKKPDPSLREVLKEANAVIPGPQDIRKAVEAVLTYIYAKDADIERKLATRAPNDDSPRPDKFLKEGRTVRETVRRQFTYIDKGCLSDPPSNVVNLFRYNPVTDTTYVARGTNTNERDNLDLATKILTATHIGKYKHQPQVVGTYQCNATLTTGSLILSLYQVFIMLNALFTCSLKIVTKGKASEDLVIVIMGLQKRRHCFTLTVLPKQSDIRTMSCPSRMFQHQCEFLSSPGLCARSVQSY
jgi:hypothetical protein